MRSCHRPDHITQFMVSNSYQIVFNDMGSELADPSTIAAPLRPAEMFKVVDLENSLNIVKVGSFNGLLSRWDRFH